MAPQAVARPTPDPVMGGGAAMECARRRDRRVIDAAMDSCAVSEQALVDQLTVGVAGGQAHAGEPFVEGVHASCLLSRRRGVGGG
jgi:hypothetical protein